MKGEEKYDTRMKNAAKAKDCLKNMVLPEKHLSEQKKKIKMSAVMVNMQRRMALLKILTVFMDIQKLKTKKTLTYSYSSENKDG